MHWKGNTNYLFKYLSYLRKLNDHNGRPIYWLCMGLGLGRHVVFSWADTLRTCVVLICDFHAFGPNILGGVEGELHEFFFWETWNISYLNCCNFLQHFPILLLLSIGERLCIGVGFGHKILAQA
jgi:hypothetical protein